MMLMVMVVVVVVVVMVVVVVVAVVLLTGDTVRAIASHTTTLATPSCSSPSTPADNPTSPRTRPSQRTSCERATMTSVCRYFLQGNCSYGSQCRFLHPGQTTRGGNGATSGSGQAGESRPKADK